MKDEQFEKFLSVMKPQPTGLFIKVVGSLLIAGSLSIAGIFFAMYTAFVRMEVTIDNMQSQMSSLQEFAKEPKFTKSNGIQLNSKIEENKEDIKGLSNFADKQKITDQGQDFRIENLQKDISELKRSSK